MGVLNSYQDKNRELKAKRQELKRQEAVNGNVGKSESFWGFGHCWRKSLPRGTKGVVRYLPSSTTTAIAMTMTT